MRLRYKWDDRRYDVREMKRKWNKVEVKIKLKCNGNEWIWSTNEMKMNM